MSRSSVPRETKELLRVQMVWNNERPRGDSTKKTSLKQGSYTVNRMILLQHKADHVTPLSNSPAWVALLYLLGLEQ